MLILLFFPSRKTKPSEVKQIGWGLTPDDDKQFLKIVYWANDPPEEKREHDWFPHKGNIIVRTLKCLQHKCMFSNNRQLAGSSDALLIHVSKTQHYPTFHPTNQKWIFYEGSSPPLRLNKYPSTFYEHADHFNFLSTYSSHHSTVPAPMVPWHQCKSGSPMTPQPNKVRDIAKSKPHTAAWILNRCHEDSFRYDYIKALAAYIQVDTLGQCDIKSRCPKGHEDCIHNVLQSDYKFLLAFEDALCADYVTSQLAIAYTIDVVPVVLGAVNYEKLLPLGSYINAKDFKSPKDLGEYLQVVASNHTLYEEYLGRRYHSSCTINKPYLCELCEYLHNTKSSMNRLKGIQQYWNSEKMCLDGKEFYTNLGLTIQPKEDYTTSHKDETKWKFTYTYSVADPQMTTRFGPCMNEENKCKRQCIFFFLFFSHFSLNAKVQADSSASIPIHMVSLIK